MNPSNPAKFGVAFAAGLVVALAAVSIYIKTSGIHIQAPGPAPIVQQRQPESLNPIKTEDAAPTPKLANPVAPAVESPAPAPAPPPQPQVAKAPRTVTSHLARAHYPSHAAPPSDGAMRVEVSQMNQPPAPNPSASQVQVPVPAAPPMRTITEDQATPAAPVYNPPTPPPQPHTVTLQAGTSLTIRLGETLSTDKNYSGDTFRATLDRPIVLDGFVIADKGSKVLGKIVGLDKAGKFEGTSNLQLVLTEINTTDGQRVHIQTGFVDRKGPANNGAGAAKVGGGAVLGAVIGAIAGGGKGAAIGAGAGGAIGAGTAMAGKGRPAVIQTETQLTFQLSSPTTITEHLN